MEGCNEVRLPVFRVQEQHGPDEAALTVQVDPLSRGVGPTQTEQAQFGGNPLLITVVMTMLSLLLFSEVNTSGLQTKQHLSTNTHLSTKTILKLYAALIS